MPTEAQHESVNEFLATRLLHGDRSEFPKKNDFICSGNVSKANHSLNEKQRRDAETQTEDDQKKGVICQGDKLEAFCLLPVTK